MVESTCRTYSIGHSVWPRTQALNLHDDVWMLTAVDHVADGHSNRGIREDTCLDLQLKESVSLPFSPQSEGLAASHGVGAPACPS